MNSPGLLPTKHDSGERGHGFGIQSVWNKTDMVDSDPESLEPIGYANQTTSLPQLKDPIRDQHGSTGKLPASPNCIWPRLDAVRETGSKDSRCYTRNIDKNSDWYYIWHSSQAGSKPTNMLEGNLS